MLLFTLRVATVAGKIMSLSNCIGNVTRLMSRNLYLLINSASKRLSLNWYSGERIYVNVIDSHLAC